ncbi:hypothetical protein J6590_018483 [Homalodisca vitripennis]|nr:hypothetical protein J6590_018483 [Homalodisca vitripennis]
MITAPLASRHYTLYLPIISSPTLFTTLRFLTLSLALALYVIQPEQEPFPFKGPSLTQPQRFTLQVTQSQQVPQPQGPQQEPLQVPIPFPQQGKLIHHSLFPSCTSQRVFGC